MQMPVMAKVVFMGCFIALAAFAVKGDPAGGSASNAIRIDKSLLNM
jgi:hypothetical protein